MNVYIYAADMWCADCARAKMEQLGDSVKSEDSDHYPQGPYDSHQQESDTPYHCAGCQTFLEVGLTDYGRKYVVERYHENKDSEVVQKWVDYYEVDTSLRAFYTGPEGPVEDGYADRLTSADDVATTIGYLTVCVGPIDRIIFKDSFGRELDDLSLPCDFSDLEAWFE